MNQEQACLLLELLRQINGALERIEKLLTEEFGPPVGRDEHREGSFVDHAGNWQRLGYG